MHKVVKFKVIEVPNSDINPNKISNTISFVYVQIKLLNE